jgi:hypothetical protein
MIRRTLKFLLWLLLGLSGLCLAAAGISALANRGLPTQSASPERLTDADRARLVEALHLRQSLGDSVWPGWGSADIPVILYNEQYAFLTGLDRPAPGWVKVPETATRGAAWDMVQRSALNGHPVYRQPVSEADRAIGAFTVRVGESWTACLGTRDWSQVSFVRGMRAQFPPLVREVVPYPLIWQLLMGETDRYLAALMHESFHAYQGTLLPEKLDAAEQSARLEKDYPWDASQTAWQAELDALAAAVQSSDRDEQVRLVKRFLELRRQRRASLGLPQSMVDYERQREWLEGLAKYAELSIGLAASGPAYQPVQGLARLDAQFKGYAEYRRFYQEQLTEVNRLSGRSEETRFYYAGMAQAVILDRIEPGWKALVMQEGVYIEDVLEEALNRMP